MGQVEVKDFSLSEPDLASIIKQIYSGALLVNEGQTEAQPYGMDPDLTDEAGALGRRCEPLPAREKRT
jgi:hypothetical protein